jgi:hypothetical protein
MGHFEMGKGKKTKEKKGKNGKEVKGERKKRNLERRKWK